MNNILGDKISKSIAEKIIVEVPLTSISNMDINPRKGGLVMENVETLVEAQEFPEIHLGFYDGELIVVDGYHRVAASQKLERETIKAFILEYNDLDELKKAAFLANVNHGIKLSQLDIALNIYEFYISAMEKRPTAKLSDIIKEYHVQERTGRQLFYWTLFNREILENKSIELSNLSKYEDYNKLIRHKKEKIGSISEEFKIFFKEFYEKYDDLPTTNRRQAIDYYIEGKEYFEEVQKDEERIKEMQARDRESRILETDYIGEDAVDRQGIDAGTGVGAVTSGQANPTIEQILEDAENGVVDTPEKKRVKKESMSNTIIDISTKFSQMYLLSSKGHLDISKEDYENLNSIMDTIDGIISSVDSSKFYEGNNI